MIACKTEYASRPSDFGALAQQYLPGLHPYENRESFLREAALAAHDFPKQLLSDLYDFKKYGNPMGCFVIHSLPLDEGLIDTPENLDDVARKKQTFHSEFWLSAVGSLLGEPFSYVQENKGNLFHNVRPAKSQAYNLCSESSGILLDLHSETAFHPFYPDFLLLHCLREDRNGQAKTLVAPVAAIRDKISPELESTLRQPLFKTGIDCSFGSPNMCKGNGPIIPILYGDPLDPLIIFDPDLMVGLTEKASQAIIELKALLDGVVEGVFLRAGDLLIVDNHRALHGRNAFRAYYDGKDRWLQRIYVTRNLLRAELLFGRKERIITHQFSLAG